MTNGAMPDSTPEQCTCGGQIMTGHRIESCKPSDTTPNGEVRIIVKRCEACDKYTEVDPRKAP